MGKADETERVMKWKELDGEERYRVVELARKGEVPLSEICETFGVSRQTLYRAMEKAERASMAALEPKTAGRKGKSEQEVSLEAAQMTIDMLTMLQTKTAGNLGPDEKKMLDDIVSSLQMNYVATSQESGTEEAAGDEPSEAEAQAEPGEEGASEEGAPDIEAKPGGDPKDPKFHKSYG